MPLVVVNSSGLEGLIYRESGFGNVTNAHLLARELRQLSSPVPSWRAGISEDELVCRNKQPLADESEF